MNAPAPFVLAFDDERCTRTELAGGKGASLARMTLAGLVVPPGFVITSAAFAAAVDSDTLPAEVRAGNLVAARDLVRAAIHPRDQIAERYATLAGAPVAGAEVAGAPVAVRSSACAEDSVAASYAGQQDTFLNVAGLEQVLTAVTGCWLSFFSDRAVFYRREKGSLDDLAMAVVVQRMVDARTSGVMFTVDPVHQRRDRIIVEAARGLGERVVSGEVTPDYYRMDRSGNVKQRRVVDEQVLTDAQLAELTKLGLHVADLYGCPQDIEWAFDDQQRLHVLQARPVTTM
jgi:pyruvate,water dikinase